MTQYFVARRNVSLIKDFRQFWQVGRQELDG